MSGTKPNSDDPELQAMINEVQRKRLNLAGRDNYAEGYWHGIAVGMLAILDLKSKATRRLNRKAKKQ